MMKYVLPLLFAIVLSACTINPTDSQYHAQNEDKNGRKLMTGNEAKPNYDRIYNHFDDPEKTNQNPNFIGITHGSETNRADVRKAVQVVRKYTNYEPGSVWINGNDMWVTVHTRRNMSDSQREKEQARLYKLLTKSIPNYNMRVRID
ncbi:hypothetical protein [Anoxybacteroides tepidamans]|uniref:hypothetical protein n=1 Tax=Anoxybacteroides tepidamans TaxID=265948 RepID=UPI001E56D09A|nr:hypothetical protein [Anoxybacillus tepidamans]